MNIADRINNAVRAVSTESTDSQFISIEQAFPATPEQLWSACTTAEGLGRWFEPTEGDLEVGGRYRLTGSGTSGAIETCSPPSSFTITWEYGGDVSRVAVTITAVDEHSSTLRLVHYGPVDQHWQTYGPAAGGAGWDESFLALSLFLQGDPRSTPENMESFGSKPDGREFLVRSVDSWRAAHLAAGADPDEAERCARATLDAYSSESWSQ